MMLQDIQNLRYFPAFIFFLPKNASYLSMEELPEEELAQFVENWKAILNETPLKFRESLNMGTTDEVDVYIYWPDHYEDDDFVRNFWRDRALLALLESFPGDIYEMVTTGTGVDMFRQDLPEHEVTKFSSMIKSKIEKILE